MSPQIVDIMARKDAAAALSDIRSHERICAERYGNITTNLGDLKRGVEGLYRRFWIAAISTISMLATACFALIYMVINKH